MIERVLLDMDGVLVQMAEGVCEFHNKPWPYKEGERGPWKLAPLLGLTEEECWAPLGYDYWRNQKPYPYMREFVDLLEEHFGPENICLLSAPIETRGCIDGKRDWIAEHLPDYKWRCQFGWAKQFCASPNSVMIDDRESNIIKFKKAGGHTFLVPGAWNNRFQEHPLEALKEWIAALKVLDKSRL